MNNESTTIDYFNAWNSNPIGFNESRDKGWRSVEVYVEPGVEPLTAEDAKHAIAGILQLYQKPTEDLHGYTEYLEAASSFVRSIDLYQEAAKTRAEAKPSDPLSGLGI